MKRCQYCATPLPPDAPRSQRFCRKGPGEPRCSDLQAQKIARLRAQDPYNIQETLAWIRRSAPPGAIGFRILQEENGGLFIGPRPESRTHSDANGQRHPGGYYTWSEEPRVPKTGEYKVHFVVAKGYPSIPGEAAIVVSLLATGGDFRRKAGPEARKFHQAMAQGNEDPRRVRVYELAKRLGIPSSELIAEMEKQGLKIKNAQTSFDSATVARLVRWFLERSRPELGSLLSARDKLAGQKMPVGLPTGGTGAVSTSGELPSGVQVDGASQRRAETEEFPNAGRAAGHDEQSLIPPLMRRQYEEAKALFRAAEDLFTAKESASIRQVDEINQHVQTIENEVDLANGVVLTKRSKSE